MENQIPQQNLNLITQVPATRVVRPRGFYKSIVFDALTVISAVGVSYLYRRYLGGTASTLLLMGGLALFSIFSALQIFVTKEFSRRSFVMVLQVIALVSFFWSWPIQTLGSLILLLLFFLAWGELKSRRELHNGLSIRFFKVVRPQFTKLTTAVVLMFLILYLPQWDTKNIFVSEKNFEYVFSWATGIVNNFYPELDFSSSVGNLMKSVTRLQVGGTSAFLNLPTNVREQVIDQGARQLLENVRKSVGFVLEEGQSTTEVFYGLALETLKGWHERFGGGFVAAWVVVAFLVIRGFGTLFYWAVSALAFLVYQLFLAMDILRVTGESRTHEVIEFS